MKILRLIAFVFLLLGTIGATAQNSMGGNLSWISIGGNQYQITLTRYLDCFGTGTISPTEDIFIFPSGCSNLVPLNPSLNLVSNTEVSELCPSELANSSCSGGLNQGVQRLVYSASVTLDPTCTWKLIYSGRIWNYFNNITWNSLPDSYITSTISLAGSTSAVLTPTFPVAYECLDGNTFTNALGITLPPGVTATYSAINPQSSGATFDVSTNTPGYTPINGLSINATTGAVSFNSTGMTAGVYVVPVLITLTQGGTPVGTMTENLSIVVRDCTNTPTTFNPDGVSAVTSSTGNQANLTTVEVCAGDSICFEVSAENSNLFRSIALSESHPTVLNAGNPVFIQNPLNINPAVGQFCMDTDQSMVGTHTIQFSAIDDACTLPSSDAVTVTLIVHPNVSLSVTDALICNGQSVTTVASGAPSYSWTVISGDASPGFDGNNATQVLESITTDTEIEVSVPGVPAFCNARDTLEVLVSLQTVTLTPTAESCLQNDGEVSLAITGSGNGNYTYLWTPGNLVAQNITGLDEGNYTVVVTDTDIPGCNATQTTTVNGTPAPGGTFTGATTICSGASATLTFNLTGTGPWIVDGTGSGVAWPLTITTSPHTITVSPTITTTYTMSSVSYQAFPLCVTPVNIPVIVTVRQPITGTFTQAGPSCAGTALPITVNFSTPGSYDVTYTASPADPPSAPNPPSNPWSDGQILTSFNPNFSTTYTITSVAYTDLPTCASAQNNAMTVVVNNLPQASLSGTSTICSGASTNLSLLLNGNGPWSVNGSGAGVSWPLLLNNAASNVSVSPGATTSYCITSVTDVNSCTTSNLSDCETITVTGLVAPSVTIAANPSGAICQGQSVTFTATPTNTGTAPTYQWKVNGINSGTNTTNNTFISTTLTNADVVTCVMTSDLACSSPTTATSNAINMVVNANVTPALSIAPVPAGPICAGTNVTFTVTPTNGGATPSYQWFVAGNPVGTNSATFSSNTLTNGEVVSCTLTSSQTCVTAATASAQQTMTVNPILVPTILVSANPSGPVCNGTSVTYTATITNGGTSPIYGWVAGGSPVGTNSNTFISNSLASGTQVSCTLSGIDGCTSTTTISSSPVSVQVDPLVTPAVNIASSTPGPICQGTSVIFTATPTNGGAAPTYSWTVAGVNQGTGSTFTTTTLNDLDQVVCTMTSNATCLTTSAATSNILAIGVTPIVTPSVAIVQAPTGPICSGTNVTFTATPTNGGANPTYAWTVDGTPQGTNSPTFISNALTNGQVVRCNLTSTATCVTSANAQSNTITMVVNPNLTPSISISANPGIVICAGASVAFTATITNGGTNPQLSWVVDGTPNGQTGTTFTTTALTNGQQVFCTLTSNETCVTSATVNSNTIGMTVNPNLTPAVSIAALPTGAVCNGTSVTFTATPTNEGTTPIYQWFVAGAAVGTNSNTYTTSALTNGQQVSCTMTSSATCVTATNANSNTITMNIRNLPTANITVASANVCAGQSYTFNVNLSGTVPFSYEVYRDGALFNTYSGINSIASSFSTSLAGSYTIRSVSDQFCANNTETAATVLTSIPSPSASWVYPDTTFCSGTTFDALASLTGTAPFLISINNGPAQTVNSGLYTRNVSTTSTLTITSIQDANSCLSQPNDAITITEIIVPVADAGPARQICSGQSVTLGTTAETGVTYSWTNGSFLSSASVAQPTATATYSGAVDLVVNLILTASRSQCSSSDATTLTVSPLPTIDVTAVSETLCYGDATTLTATGGSTYSWTPNPGISSALNAATISIQPVATSWYYVTGSDANSCSSSDSIRVVVGAPLQVVEDFTAQLCFNECTGFINLTPSGGFAPYTVSWANPAVTGFNPTALCAGNYGYVITDDQGCNTAADALNITIVGLPQNTIDLVTLVQPVCFGDETGELSVTEPGATSYSLFADPSGNLIATGASADFTGLASGDYVVEVIDADGCTVTSATNTIVSVSPEIILTATQFATPFCYEAIVPFEATATGGIGTLTFHWGLCAVPSGCALSTANPYNFTLTQNTTLFVDVTDQLGCTTEAIAVEALLNDPIQLTIMNGQPVPPICQGQCIDLISSTTGGNGGVVVDWIRLPGTISSTPSPTTVCPLVDTEYMAYAYDGCNPPAFDTLNVIVNPTPEVTILADTLEGCFPLTVELSYDTDPALVDQCNWVFGDGTSLSVCGNIPPHTYNNFGSFVPHVTITSSEGCSNSDTLNTPIMVYGFPETNFEWTPDPVSVLERDVQFINLTQGATSYQWNLGGLSQSTLSNPRYQFPDIDLGTYDICLYATNENGCTDTLCKTLVIESILQVFAPTAFTPDQDKLNEVWVPIINGADPKVFHLWIFDRWGNTVFESTDPDTGWTGSVNGGEFYPQQEMFVWRLELKHLGSNETEVFFGNLTLLR
jgi:gliding motility-associated-like protein